MATKAKKARKPRAKMAKQEKLYETRPDPIPAIDQAAETYYDAMQERLPLTKAEKEAKESLIETMLAAGVNRYETSDGKIVSLTGKQNVTVKPKKEESNGEAE